MRWITVCVALTIAACGGEPRDGRCEGDEDCGDRQTCEDGLCQNEETCSASAANAPALRVLVREMGTEREICDATVTASIAGGRDIVLAPVDGLCRYEGANGLTGSFSVVVTHPNFEETAADAEVEVGPCGPLTETVEAMLQPEDVS